MRTVPFKYCALRFLVQWFDREEPLYRRMSKDPSSDVVRETLRYFNVARSFKGLGSDKEAELVRANLLKVKTISGVDPAEKVNLLAGKFKDDFGCYAVSAASKLLWMTNREGFLIYDSRAVSSLRKHGFSVVNQDYGSFETVWRQVYSDHSMEIEKAVGELPKIRQWLPVWGDTSSKIESVLNQSWFSERVFDIYLWESG